MKYSILASLLALTIAFITPPAFSQEKYTKTLEGEFEDVLFDLKDAIVNIGLGVDYTGDVAAMLERTQEAATGSTNKSELVYKQAQYLLFCSSKLTHKAAASDAGNLAICPFLVYAFETTKTPGMVTIGYRNPDFGNLDSADPLSVEVHAFLKNIIDSTAEGY
ncbi:MAG: hypothetical protein L3J32_07165 [Rhizobiaceae bacterium]|nr:hypothetical protein [Rhizobiaceae bacterium]